MNATATMPEGKRTIYLGKEDYTRIFKDVAETATEKLTCFCETIGKGWKSVKTKVCDCFGKIGGAQFAKPMCPRNQQHFVKPTERVTDEQSNRIPNQHRHYNEMMGKGDEEISKPIEPIIEREA